MVVSVSSSRYKPRKPSSSVEGDKRKICDASNILPLESRGRPTDLADVHVSALFELKYTLSDTAIHSDALEIENADALTEPAPMGLRIFVLGPSTLILVE
jgi:hypothetical protein